MLLPTVNGIAISRDGVNMQYYSEAYTSDSAANTTTVVCNDGVTCTRGTLRDTLSLDGGTYRYYEICY